MSMSTIRRKLKDSNYRIEKVVSSDNLYRLIDLRQNVYCGGYDCYYTVKELENLVADDGE